MKITQVRVRKIENGGKRVAVASITIDDVFVIHDVSIIESQNGTFISMPSKRMPNGEFRDIAHPITSECRTQIQDAVLEEYAKIMQ